MERAESGSASRATRFCGATALTVVSCAGLIELNASEGRLGMSLPQERGSGAPSASAHEH